MSIFDNVNTIANAMRSIFILLDMFVYYWLQWGFELFFHIVTFNVVDSEMIYNIVSRVQLVVGIFMMFQLVMIIIKGIVNPDTVTDSKSGGAGNVIMRIIVSLALLALIVPINIPSPKNEYEKQINNNGIMFGTLYSLQYRILTNNTIGKLILGSDASSYTSKNPDETDLHDFANRFTTTIVRVFYPLNTDDEGNYICQDGWDEEYYNDDREPLWIISQGTRKCGGGYGESFTITGAIIGGVEFVMGKEYAISMSYLTSTVVALIFMVLIFIMVYSVAKRVFQLAALQLLAPIPIISYMDPKGSKDGAFNSWLKLLGKTYLDLFIRIGAMYFVIGIIQAFMDKYFGSIETMAGTAWDTVSGAYGGYWYSFTNGHLTIIWEFIVIVIGLLLFAIEAPKFIKQMLGVKDDGKGFFSDFGMAMGLGVSAVGAIGSFRASQNASRSSITERAKQYAKDHNMSTEETKNYINQELARNRGRHTAAGVLGASSGFITGANAAINAKGGLGKSVAAINAMNARNSKALAAGRAGGGFLGAIGSGVEQLVSGESPYDRMFAQWQEQENELKNRELKLKETKDQKGHLEANLNRHKSKSEDCVWTRGSHTINGLKVTANYRDFDSNVQAALDHGTNVVKLYEYRDVDPTGALRVTRFTQTEYDQLAGDFQKECVDVSYLNYKNDAGDTFKIPMGSLKDFRIGLKDANDKDRAQKTTECALRVMDLMYHDGMTKDDAIERAKEDMKTEEFMAADPALDEATARTNAHAYVTSDEHKGEDVFDDSIYNHMLGYRNSRIAEIIANTDPDQHLTTDNVLNADYNYRHRANPNDGQPAPYVIDMPDTLGMLKKAIGDTGARIDSENDEINRLHVKVNEAKRRVEATAAEKNRDYLFKNK